MLTPSVGLSVAQAVHHYYTKVLEKTEEARILTVCGPGNNGGDGLVAARHLKLFGFKPVVFYPKRTEKDIYKELVVQLENMEVPFVSEMPEYLDSVSYDLILDAIFGFSFTGEIRSPFDSIIEAIGKSEVPICSIDVPSGWNVDEGNVNGTFTPAMLISLTAPKMCSKDFEGVHYCGGRFVPKYVIKP